MALSPLSLSDLPAATELLAAACPFDRAAEVAAEKLFGPAPSPDEPPHPWGYWKDGALAGVACVSGDHLRLLAVAPEERGAGVGGQLLEVCEKIADDRGAAALHVLGQPGNYLAPGVDVRNAEAISWLLRRDYYVGNAPQRVSLLVDLATNPKVTAARAAEVTAAVEEAGGYRVRRATAADGESLRERIAAAFGGAWPFEVARALSRPEPGVHVAMRGDELCAFAAHDGNNSGLGWFGPAGTWPAHRGRRLGEALLLACLVDVARVASTAEIAWIGPEAFYEASCGIAGRRIFVAMKKALR
jgi:GNAT superfamily N-acetyltransferase